MLQGYFNNSLNTWRLFHLFQGCLLPSCPLLHFKFVSLFLHLFIIHLSIYSHISFNYQIVTNTFCISDTVPEARTTMIRYAGSPFIDYHRGSWIMTSAVIDLWIHGPFVAQRRELLTPQVWRSGFHWQGSFQTVSWSWERTISGTKDSGDYNAKTLR